MSEALIHIREKLQRADKHITELEGELDTFINKTPHRELVDYDAESLKAFKDFHRDRGVPPFLSVITSDAIHQLRSSLDHLACALILREAGTLTEYSQFPICLWRPNSTKKDEVRRYERQIEGIKRDAVRTMINDLQPYTRGDRRHAHWLAILKDFSNIDKHRALVSHVTAIQPRISSMEIHPRSGLTSESDSIDDGAEFPSSYVDPLGGLVEVVKVQRRVTAFVAFAKWEGAPYEFPVTYALFSLLRGIRAIVTDFEPFLS